jgi:hypothetical protein
MVAGDPRSFSANASLKRCFGIEHTTLQIETGDTAEVCRQDCSGDH